MKNLLLLSAALNLDNLSSPVCCQQDYTLPLLGHGIKGENYDLQVQYQLVDQGTSGANVVTDTGLTFNVPSSAAVGLTMIINETDLPIQSQLKNKTRTVSVDADVTMQVITTINGHSEGYQAIPDGKLGTEYYVSTFCALGEYCQVVIGSTVAGTTQVYLQLPAEVDEIGFCIGNGTWTSSTETTITLHYPEVVQLETRHDLTGTRIYSDNPVAVVAGSRTITGSTPMYHLAEQLAPVPEWGTLFFVRPIGTSTYGSIVHITSRYRKTFVTMDGFRTVELTGYGQTIKRRIVLGSAVEIKSSQPVQVMLYTGFTHASNETITNPGMTLIPTVDHWYNRIRFVCHTNNPNDVIQVIKKSAATITEVGVFGVSITMRIEYTDYVFREYVQGIPSSSLQISSSAFTGIMTCNSSAIFPIVAPVQSLVFPTFCPSLAALPSPNDGHDNDCDGSIDEDFCFENRMFAAGSYSMVNNAFVGQRSYTESIVDFTLIKIRLRSCGDVKVELLAGSDKLVMAISKEVITIYKCVAGAGCVEEVFKQTHTYLQAASTNCDTLVPYWIRKNSTHLCMDVGPFPVAVCPDPTSTVDVSSLGFTDMVMFGLHSNAVFYYDVYRADCGGLESDWRCTDMANNCWEYESDLCTTYADWAKINCRKFCGFCAPDSVGKMFVVLPADHPDLSLKYHVVASDLSDSSYNSVSSDQDNILFSPGNASTKDGSAIVTRISSGNVSNRVYIVYTSAESHLFVSTYTTKDIVTIPIYPIDALGTEYMTLSFFPESQCVVASPEGPTIIRISTKTSFKTYQINLYDDIALSGDNFTGTVIASDRPTAVFCYNPDGANPANHYWNQLMPVSSWGTEYIIPALNTSNPSTSFTATARIAANSANTRVDISGDFQSIELLSARGDFLDQTIDPGVTYTINSNFPIGIVVLYEETVSGAKSMINVPPVDNYMDLAAIFHNDLSGQAHFTAIKSDSTLTSESAASPTSSDLFHQSETIASLVMSISNDLSAFQADVEMSVHPVHMSGHLVKDSEMARICTVTKGTIQDGVDNDCDGLVDEETSCLTGYGSINDDADLDGDFGEDCLASAAVSPVVSPPTIPVCLNIVIPRTNDSHCWTPCTCPCDWIDALSEYKNMTQEEKDASNLEKIQTIVRILYVDKTLLSATTAELESADDSRESSTNIGLAGVVLLILICSLIFFFDFINVIRYFRKLGRRTAMNKVQ